MIRLFVVCASILLVAATLSSTKPRIYVVGDSTACIYTSSYYPRTGWAQVLSDFFDTTQVEIVDDALSGRSSRSFYDEGAWTSIKSALKSGDYVIIQFGHNDEKVDDAARGTLPGSTYEQYLSIYIDETLAKGAIPILMTPLERNGWTNATTVKSSHITSSGDYPQAVRNLSASKNIPLVDMTVLSKAFYESCGKDSTTNKIFMNLTAGEYSNYPSGNTDNTHLQYKGAIAIANLFVNDIIRQDIQPMAAWLKNDSSSAEIPSVAVKIPGTSYVAADGIDENTNAGFESESYLNMNNVLGSSAEYVICASQDADTKISIRYANGGTADRPMSLTIDGNDSDTFLFQSGKSWTLWQFETRSIHLNQGTHYLKMISTGTEGGPNIDWIGFSDPGITAGKCTSTSLKNSPPLHLQPGTRFTTYQINGKKVFIPSLYEKQETENAEISVKRQDQNMFIIRYLPE